MVAIGGKGRYRWKKPHEYVWGYATGLDMTRRDRQMEMRQIYGTPVGNWQKRSISPRPLRHYTKAAETHNVDNAPLLATG